jgi:hypothetical protein
MSLLFNQSNLTQSLPPMENCSLACQEIFILAVNYIKIVNKIFARPFPSLGTFTTLFSQNIFSELLFFDIGNIEREFHNFSGKFLNQIYSSEKEAISLYELYSWGGFHQTQSNWPKFMLEHSICSLIDYSNIFADYYEYSLGKSDYFPCWNQSNPCCNILTKNLIGNHLEQFMSIMKYSEGSNNFLDDEQHYMSSFVQNSSLLENLEKVSRDKNPIGMLLFCDMVKDLSTAFARFPGCTNTSAVSTSHGVCQSFNSAPSTDIYKNLPYSQVWNLVFSNNITNRPLVYPKGNGAAKGMYFILNSYESFGFNRHSNDFILSITNENNPFDIAKSNFNLLPGQIYSFRVMQSQIGTTSNFDSMNFQDRSCALPNENGKLRYMKMYTKSACEYECALEKAAKRCFCIPWNLPRLSLEDPPFCDMLGNLCFAEAMKNDLDFEACDCPNDCKSTALNIFETSKQINDFKAYCGEINDLFFHFTKFIKANHYYGLYYNHLVNDGLDPGDDDALCQYLIQNHITIVKVELTAKRIMRSIRDKKFSFENQLSTLGKLTHFKANFSNK